MNPSSADARRKPDQALQDLHLPAEVVMRDAPYSAAELQTLVDRIVGDFDYWRGIGVPISFLSARQDGTAVEVGAERQDQLKRLVAQRYGAVPPIVVIRGG